ncbi:sulfotransferase domain-containing protein [Autumnicola psychrophila]|uniref:Sulfotransferase domain-containing protein n=1 Tax=Autumnicola psychrophila TaxID=3075592 RepID=A0ABU3DS94_9FLAO|nr:sulfotransferase domain-containing protein [Zunongwangia sp. F225]MDT0686588.1 sulfotransferase domain-containing protein [Zunongwangia sp. F225]
MEKNIKLISIMGYARSGTTFLGTYASHCGEKVFFAGEIDKGIEKYLANRPSLCSCGESYQECPVWSKILPEISKENLNLEFIFEKIHELTGATIIIDSSKNLEYIKKFKKIFGSNFYTIHLKRNPKGVILSRMNNRMRRIKAGKHPKPQLASKYTLMALYDSLEWSYHNYWMEKVKEKERNLNLTYDSFETELPEKINSFFDDMDVSKGDDFLENHVVYGANGRLNYSKEIKVNKSWRKKLSGYQKGLVNISTLPIRSLYGYKF